MSMSACAHCVAELGTALTATVQMYVCVLVVLGVQVAIRYGATTLWCYDATTLRRLCTLRYSDATVVSAQVRPKSAPRQQESAQVAPKQKQNILTWADLGLAWADLGRLGTNLGRVGADLG